MIRTLLFMAAGVLTASVFGASPPVADTDPAALLRRIEAELGSVRTVQARFAQEKRLTVFDHVLIVRGRMAMERAGNRLAWRVIEPARYTLIISSDKCQQWDEDTDRVQTLAASENPAFKAVFEQSRIWFTGRYSELLGDHDVRVQQTAPALLVFTPKTGSPSAQAVKSVTLRFDDDVRYLRELTICEGNDDVTVIRFFDTRLNEAIDAAVWRARPGGR